MTIVMPGGKDEEALCLREKLEQTFLVVFIPSVIVVGMAANIGGVAVYQIAVGSFLDRVTKILMLESDTPQFE